MTEAAQHPNRWVIAIMGTMLQLCLGTVYAWSFFQKPIMTGYGWSNSEASWAFSLAICFLGLAAAWGGMNLPRYGPRKLAMIGGMLFSAGYMFSAFALSIKCLPALWFSYGVIGGIGLGLGYVTPVATAAKWFPDKKGFVTGMVVMGFGFGALLMSKVIAPLFMEMSEGNLVTVFLYIGILMFFLTLTAGYFLQNPLAGYVPRGYTPQAVSATQQIADDAITAGQCILSGKFMLMWIIFFFNITAGIIFIGFQSPMIQDMLKGSYGLTYNDPESLKVALAAAGATLIAVSSIFNGIGRFFWGGLSDKIGRAQTFRVILATQVAAFIALRYINSPVLFSILVCYVLFCYGGGFGTMPSFVLDVFGARLMPVVYGVILTAWSFAGIAGPQIAAVIKDNYKDNAGPLTFTIGAGMLVIGFIISLFLNNSPFETQKGESA